MTATPVARFARHAANATWRDVDWARDRLREHAGKTLAVEIWPFGSAAFALTITPEGDWADVPVGDAAGAVATLRLGPAMLPRVVAAFASAPDKPGAAADLDGDAELVRTLRDLLDVLPLALEERVQKVAGPVIAHGVSAALRALAAWPLYAAERFGSGIATYLTEESPTLAKRAAFAAFCSDAAALEARADRLLAQSAPRE